MPSKQVDLTDAEKIELAAAASEVATMLTSMVPIVGPIVAAQNGGRTANPKDLISRQGPNEMSGSKVKRLRKSMSTSGYDSSKPIDVADVGGGRLIILDGHHRAKAAAGARINQVPINVLTPTKAQADQLLIEAAEARF